MLDIAQQAMRDCDIEPVLKPIRGGTGRRTAVVYGITVPNLFTGGYNYHGKHEFVTTLEGMEKAVQVIVRIAELTPRNKIKHVVAGWRFAYPAYNISLQ